VRCAKICAPRKDCYAAGALTNAPANPALQAFLAEMPDSERFGQVSIHRRESGFTLCHQQDALTGRDDLREVTLEELHALAQFTASGAFRPLKSTFNLQPGWCYHATDETALERALNILYPGALADWFAARTTPPPVTHYREFVNRQTGMYRIAQTLADERVAAIAGAACSMCVKHRLWTVPGLECEGPQGKSVIPCLEPCALLLEMARRVGRMDREERVELRLAPAEIATLVAALKTQLAHGDPALREGDFAAPTNPRWVLRLLKELEPLAPPPEGESHE
jgi:hypothetical protein